MNMREGCGKETCGSKLLCTLFRLFSFTSNSCWLWLLKEVRIEALGLIKLSFKLLFAIFCYAVLGGSIGCREESYFIIWFLVVCIFAVLGTWIFISYFDSKPISFCFCLNLEESSLLWGSSLDFLPENNRGLGAEDCFKISWFERYTEAWLCWSL